MKKIISLALAVIMLITMSSTAFAANESRNSQTYIGEISNGNIFSKKTSNMLVTILTDNARRLIDISIKYLNQPNIVYQWRIQDYPVARFKPASNSFWNGIIEYAERNISSATPVTFTDVTYEKPIDVTAMRSSAGADLLQDLRSFIGQDEYFDVLKTSTPLYRNGVAFRVYESMQFRILLDGYKAWSTTITVASLITGILGLALTNPTITAICSAFGVAATAASLILPGRVNKYICRAMVYRYVNANGSKYVYNITDKFIDYKGYENADNNSTERAYADSSSQTINYIQGQSYFGSYTAQVDDAYQMYLNVGQQP